MTEKYIEKRAKLGPPDCPGGHFSLFFMSTTTDALVRALSALFSLISFKLGGIQKDLPALRLGDEIKHESI